MLCQTSWSHAEQFHPLRPKHKRASKQGKWAEREVGGLFIAAQTFYVYRLFALGNDGVPLFLDLRPISTDLYVNPRDARQPLDEV